MPDVQYGPPPWTDWSDWEQRLAAAKKAKAIQDSIDRASFFNAIKDWSSAKSGGKSTTHEAAKAAGFTGDTAGAADLFLHYQLGPLGRLANRLIDIDWKGTGKNKYDDVRDQQIDAWNKQMGPNASYENLFRDVVNNPGIWELRSDPVGKQLWGSTSSGVLSQGGIPTSSMQVGPNTTFFPGHIASNNVFSGMRVGPFGYGYTADFSGPPVQDPVQRQGLKGTLQDYDRLMNRWLKSNYKPPKSTKFRYGPESPKFKGKAPKRESVYQREQKKRKEEEEDAFQRALMGFNRMRIGAISRPSIVPKPVWDSYVGPDGGNFARYDDIGRFIGLDTDALMESIGIGPPPGYSKRKV